MEWEWLIPFRIFQVSTIQADSLGDPTGDSTGDAMTLKRLDAANLQSLFSWMDFDGLLHMAESNPHFHQIIVNDYIIGTFGFPEKLIHITNIPNEPKNIVQITTTDIWINGFHQARRILRQFGGQIHRLSVNCSQFNGDQVQILGEAITAHLITSLHQLILHNGNQSMFTAAKHAFENCESLEVYNLGQGNGLPSISRIFPKLQRIALQATDSGDLAFLQHNLPELHEVSVDIGNSTAATTKAKVKSFLKLNTQILTLEVVLPIDAAFLTFVNAELLSLQSLNILIHPLDYAEDELTDKLDFPTVTSLTLRVIGSDLMFAYFPVTFEQLRELRLFCPEFDKLASDFIGRSKRLSVLEIYDDVLDYKRWLDLVEALPELTEITAKVHRTYIETSDKSDLVTHGLATHPALQRITIILSSLSDQSTWLKSMPPNWKSIESTLAGQMIFVRDST